MQTRPELEKLKRLRKKKEKEFRKGRYWKRRLAVLAAAIFAGVVAVVVVATATAVRGGPLPADIAAPQPNLPQTSILYDSTGKPYSYIHGSQNRIEVPLSGISPNLQHAVIAIEDDNFNNFSAVDPIGILRAAYVDIKTRSLSQGGSTLTEQLMKNLYIDTQLRQVKSWRRRIDEAYLAILYSRSHNKQQIMQNYLNTVYFGGGAYGAEVAAETYFGIPSGKLDLSQAAVLAGVINDPTALNPIVHPKAATERRNLVLKDMLDQHMVSQSAYEQAVREPMQTHPASFNTPPEDKGFALAAEQQLQQRFGKKTLQEGGLRVYTTMNSGFQSEIYQASKKALPYAGDPSAGVATVEPATGAVRALVGTAGDFDLATAAYRQPGSSFKLFTLAAAVEQGISPLSIFDSHTLHLEWQGVPYTIPNYDNVQRGPITIKKATEVSDNTVYVQLGLKVGLDHVVNTAHEMGITSPLDANPSMVIGGLNKGVTPLQMASAYATVADGGVYRSPYLFDKVEQGGKTTWRPERTSKRVLTQDQAAILDNVLSATVSNGTPRWFYNADADTGHTIAGKPGISDSFADTWFIGYTPQLSTAVWVGYPQGRIPMTDVPGLGKVYGESVPQEIFIDYMKQALAAYPDTGFPAASDAGLTVLNEVPHKQEPVHHSSPASEGSNTPDVPNPLEQRKTVDQGATTSNSVPASGPTPATTAAGSTPSPAITTGSPHAVKKH